MSSNPKFSGLLLNTQQQVTLHCLCIAINSLAPVLQQVVLNLHASYNSTGVVSGGICRVKSELLNSLVKIEKKVTDTDTPDSCQELNSDNLHRALHVQDCALQKPQ